ncbi:MAG: hypothetical protein ACE5E7_05660 [Anaerolineae bacterium]
MQNEISIMQIVRVPPMGKLVVETNGQRYTSLSEVSQAKLQRLLLAAIGELVSFVGGYQSLVEAGVAPPVQSPAPAPKPREEVLNEKQARFLAALEAERDALKEAVASKSQPPPPAQAKPAPVPAPPPPAASQNTLSIVEQINLILQQHVSKEPTLRGRSIHLVQSPGGGLRIEVDGQVFRRPGEIKDPKIQLVIKRALSDWESA